jgi:hypothetical protein
MPFMARFSAASDPSRLSRRQISLKRCGWRSPKSMAASAKTRIRASRLSPALSRRFEISAESFAKISAASAVSSASRPRK